MQQNKRNEINARRAKCSTDNGKNNAGEVGYTALHQLNLTPLRGSYPDPPIPTIPREGFYRVLVDVGDVNCVTN